MGFIGAIKSGISESVPGLVGIMIYPRHIFVIAPRTIKQTNEQTEKKTDPVQISIHLYSQFDVSVDDGSVMQGGSAPRVGEEYHPVAISTPPPPPRDT
jgi:hypothetical protein